MICVTILLTHEEQAEKAEQKFFLRLQFETGQLKFSRRKNIVLIS